MDMSNLLAGFQQLAPEFVASYCIVNETIMNLSEIQNMGYDEFSFHSKINMPPRFYRYYPNTEITEKETGKIINYSIQALENNTVFLQTPTAFDDPYDSGINIDYSEYEHLRLIEYCKRCGIEVDAKQSTQEIGNTFVKILWEYYTANGNLDHVLKKEPDSKIEQLANQWFALKIINELYRTNDFGLAVVKALQDEYMDYIVKLKTTFRTVCFATTPYSQLMWGGAYSNCHNGFCIEYTVLHNDEEYKDIYYNLFPMIYCKVRPNMTSRLVAAKDKNMTKEVLWDIYSHGALRKSIDWAFQNEWRLLLPLYSDNVSDYNVKFFPITKVYLGNRMLPERRKEIIEICHKKGIPYVGVKRNPAVFEMQDCENKCEDCPQYQNPGKSSIR
ncbi:MAG: DUF2971 domain-containing protein [Evtepia sp.]|nr:DUF2971 domain-containing protein [Evtepia sp.]